MFMVVEFTDDHSLAVIPSKWQDGNRCAVWPPYKSCRADNAAKQQEMPGDHWQSYPIRVLYESGMYLKKIMAIHVTLLKIRIVYSCKRLAESQTVNVVPLDIKAISWTVRYLSSILQV